VLSPWISGGFWPEVNSLSKEDLFFFSPLLRNELTKISTHHRHSREGDGYRVRSCPSAAGHAAFIGQYQPFSLRQSNRSPSLPQACS
jgi:hypothetical protein